MSFGDSDAPGSNIQMVRSSY